MIFHNKIVLYLNKNTIIINFIYKIAGNFATLEHLFIMMCKTLNSLATNKLFSSSKQKLRFRYLSLLP
jgi:hypothetical protein